MSSTAAATAEPLANYYRWHARIYDLTRWAFLFGRAQLIHLAAASLKPQRVLEVGCGTGRNLVELAEAFPEAEIVGLDLSADMLDRARPKLERFGARASLLHCAYETPLGAGQGFDLIVLSYSLSMMNPGYDAVLRLCQEDLSPGGSIAVVDFHDSPARWFRQWMGVNHVRMEGQVLAALREGFTPSLCEVKGAYGGLWRHLTFIGTRAEARSTEG